MNLLDAIMQHSLSASSEKHVVISGTAPNIVAQANTVYLCSETVTSLNVSSVPETGLFEIIFVSGSPAAELCLPDSVILQEDTRIKENHIYELSIRPVTVRGKRIGLAAIGEWALPETEASI